MEHAPALVSDVSLNAVRLFSSDLGLTWTGSFCIALGVYLSLFLPRQHLSNENLRSSATIIRSVIAGGRSISDLDEVKRRDSDAFDMTSALEFTASVSSSHRILG